MFPCSCQPTVPDFSNDLKSYEWYLLEKLPPELLSTGQQNLRLGPFANEQECRSILDRVRHTPGFRQRNLLMQRRVKRRHQRVEKELSVGLRRVENDGGVLHASTVNISSSGARLAGVKGELNKGEVLELQYAHRKATFQVVWIGSGVTAEQVGVECLEPESNFWNLDLPTDPDPRPLFQQVETARQVQSLLFPRERPPLRTLEYAGDCVQALMVGGDYYDFLDLGPGQVGFVLADVAGKGIAAALLMANLQGNLHSHCAIASKDPARMLDSVNRHFYKHTETHRYATLFFGCYDDSKRHLRYINCGHNPPLLLRRGGEVERLAATASVLGLFREWTGSVAEAELEEGDILGIYTDGVTEVTGKNGEEFGEAGLLNLLRENRDLPPSSLLHDIEQAVHQFSSGEQVDDLTLVIARARQR